MVQPDETAPAHPAVDASFDVVAGRAAQEGAVRVIVGVRVEAGAGDASGAIRREQDRVLEALAGTDHRVGRRYRTVPQLALTLSPEAVEALRPSGLVTSIELDEPVPPSS